MAGKDRSMKDKEMAAHLKKMGVRRSTGTHCPFGCGRPVSLGSGILGHMATCHGRRRG